MEKKLCGSALPPAVPRTYNNAVPKGAQHLRAPGSMVDANCQSETEASLPSFLNGEIKLMGLILSPKAFFFSAHSARSLAAILVAPLWGPNPSSNHNSPADDGSSSKDLVWAVHNQDSVQAFVISRSAHCSKSMPGLTHQ